VGPSTTSAQLLLAGGGHTHALVLRRWAMQPHRRPRARITLVSRHGSALYSGMVPGLVAGIYPRSACTINLRELCQRAGVSFVQAEIGGLDPEQQLLLLEGRPALPYDWLSLNLGAVTIPSGGAVAGGISSSSATAGVTSDRGPVADGAVAVKPLEPFLAWCVGLSTSIDSAANDSAANDSAANNSAAIDSADRRRVWIQGGGAAAIELAFALRARGLGPELGLRGEELRLGSRAANRLAERWLTNAGIAIHRGQQPPVPAEPAGVPTLACTGSWVPGWLAAAGLPQDGRGRLLTEASLQVQGQPRIFASGDCGVIASQPRPPSGVWAVRAAPVLAENLELLLAGGDPSSSFDRDSRSHGHRDGHRNSNSSGSSDSHNKKLRQWRPQAWALQLLADGGVAGAPRALAGWGPLTLGPSRWLWRWKDRIDRRFMALFEPPAAMAGEAAMACRGCAAKLAATPLAAALERLAQAQSAQDQPAAKPIPRDDAAVIGQTAHGELLLQSVDGFPALVDDPWLNGRLTTLHACSDLWACGARVDSVLALVTLPQAAPNLQVDLLHQTLAGVQSVLEPLQARLLGGHTMEARDGIKPEAGLAVSLSANGLVAPERHWPKGPLAPGDVLILTRGLGSGVLFAAAMAGAARPEWLDDALALMQQSQAPVVEILAAHGCRACTDITGFGLLGHLGEMLASAPAPEALRVELIAEAIPSLPGAIELLQTGYASSLAPANAAALDLLEAQVMLVTTSAASQSATHQSAAHPSKAHPSKAHQSAVNKTALLGLLIDPQTCGPLLAALPAEQGDAAVAALRAAGFGQAALVARVLAGD